MRLLLAAVWRFPWVCPRRRGADARAMRGSSSITQLGLAMPNFWLGMLLVMLFAIGLHWVSAGGFPGWGVGILAGLCALTLPAMALAMPQAAILARVLRGALMDTLHEDYIRTARAKGAGERRILWRHALPNALVPVLTILGMQFSFLLAGGVIIENVFFLPGLGRLVFQAIEQRDLIVVQSVVVVLVFAVVMRELSGGSGVRAGRSATARARRREHLCGARSREPRRPRGRVRSSPDRTYPFAAWR